MTAMIALLDDEAGDLESHREVAAAASAAKKQAKKKVKDPASESMGGSVFVERRRPGGNEVERPLTRALN